MKIKKISPQSFGEVGPYPVTPLSSYFERIKATQKKLKQMNLDFLIIFADREHSTNQEYLVGVGPRFEESILVIGKQGNPVLVLGNECQYFAPDPELEVDIVLFQDFSPSGQPRGTCNSLEKILRKIGIDSGQKIGCVGWKTYSKHLVADQEHALDIPSYLADELRRIIGSNTDLVNAVEIFTNPVDGLRIKCDVNEIAQFEYAARVASNSVRHAVDNFTIGRTEREFEKYLVSNGLTLTCHKMISFGEKVRRGLSSPSDNLCEMGSPFTIALGVSGALSARAGIIARDVKDLPVNLRSFYPDFSFNYWSAIIKWYESIKIDESGGNVYKSVYEEINSDLYELMLNPGHNLHLEEWVGSIFSEDNERKLFSGMALQSDLIPISKGPFCYSNAEDGVVLADNSLRQEIQNIYPDLWSRILKRKEFLRDSIGVILDDSVLPISDTCGVYAPYALSNDHVYVKN